MPRVHHVKKARRALPSHGIKVGDPYYWWKTRMKGARNGTMHYSKVHPRPSQLTMSEYLSEAYSIQENVEDSGQGPFKTKEDVQTVADALQDAVDRTNELRDNTDEKFNNMPEGLQQGDTGQLLEQRRDACENVISELEDAHDRLDGWEPDDDELNELEAKESDKYDEKLKELCQEAVEEALSCISWSWE